MAGRRSTRVRSALVPLLLLCLWSCLGITGRARSEAVQPPVPSQGEPAPGALGVNGQGTNVISAPDRGPPTGPLQAGLIPAQYPKHPGIPWIREGADPKVHPQFVANVLRGPGMFINPQMPGGYDPSRISSPGRDQNPLEAIKRANVEYTARQGYNQGFTEAVNLDQVAQKLLELGHEIRSAAEIRFDKEAQPIVNAQEKTIVQMTEAINPLLEQITGLVGKLEVTLPKSVKELEAVLEAVKGG